MEGKAKTANANCCKCYREKSAEEYKINDALRKTQARLLLKSNKDAYEEQNRKEAERKCLDKHRKNFAINHPHLDEEPSQTSISNSTIKSKNCKKSGKLPLTKSEKKK